jgi:tRNA 5-methylaminomethyl-2-thiouridine biosynthesis bifunctional protein
MQPSASTPEDILVEEDAPADLRAMLACLQSWARQGGATGEGKDARGRFCYVAHYPPAADSLPRAAQVAEQLTAMRAALPAAWRTALLHGWPPPLRGLHRLELAAGRVWLLITIGLARASRRRLQAQLAGWGSSGTQPPEQGSDGAAIIVGAGLAGCALADALARRGRRVTVLEHRDRPGGVVADIPLLAQHPALSPGGDRRSRLLVAAMLAGAGLEARLGDAFRRCGRFQAMTLAEARHRAASMPADIVEAVPSSDAAVHAAAGRPALWLPSGAMPAPHRWWRQVARRDEVALRLSTHVAAIRRDSGRWAAIDGQGSVIESARVLVLANQAQAFGLAGMGEEASGALRLRALQVMVGEMRPAGAPGRPAPILGIDGYRLEVPGEACVVGPVPADATPAEIAAMRSESDAYAGGDRHDYRWRLSAPAERLLLRDNLPMAGAVPDAIAIEAARDRHERNDRLPLPRRPGLYMLAGLGGRGLLWSVLGAEIVAAQMDDEPPVAEAELLDAVDPARFLRRALRRARSVPAE